VITIATGSPTNRTRSAASSGSAIGSSRLPGSPAAFSAVSTATTPGSASAAEASMPVMSACAHGLRTNVTRAARVSSGTRTSSTYVPPTVSSRSSSTRRTLRPSTPA
jgi:hypothetical protein